jgi:serine/threonine protein kinase
MIFLLIIIRGVIHRDLKPENILTGVELEVNLIYLVDYGISKIYLVDGEHMFFSPFHNIQALSATASNFWVQPGMRVSRRIRDMNSAARTIWSP